MYQDDIITLASADKTPEFEYDKDVFDRAAKWIHDRGKFTPGMLKEKPATDVINETLRVLNTGISSSITEEVPDKLTAALENNAFIFSGFKSYHSLNELGLKLTNDKGGRKSFEEFAKDAAQINKKYNRNYLYAEYNHAVHSSQMAVKWHDFQKGADRYDLQYRTAGDSKVRSQHSTLHNTTLPADDPFWSSYLPPNGWNCRCQVVQVLRDMRTRSDSKEAIKLGDEATKEEKQKIFRFNPGKELKIFPDKHPYHKAPKEVKEIVEEAAENRFTAKNINEAEVQFREKLGIANCSLDGFRKKDIGHIKEMFDSVQKHFDKYPELKEHINFVGSIKGRVNMLTDAIYNTLKSNYNYPDDFLLKEAKKRARRIASSSGCYAYSHVACKEYKLNGLAWNTGSQTVGDTARANLTRAVENKQSPLLCNTITAVFDHEVGHQMDAMLDLRTNRSYLEIYNKHATLGAQHIADNLSIYAYDPKFLGRSGYNSRAEFIAEAWAEYNNNPNPRAIAVEVGKLIESEYEKMRKKN